VTPPITKRKVNNQESVVDSAGFLVRGFDEVTKVLHTLKEHCLDENQHLAIASRSTAYDLCMQSIELLNWKQYLSSFQIYDKSKTNHMNVIKKELKFENFEEVLFFDDDYSNIKSTSSIGVFAYEVDQSKGVNVEAVIDALSKYSSNTGSNGQHLLNF